METRVHFALVAVIVAVLVCALIYEARQSSKARAGVQGVVRFGFPPAAVWLFPILNPFFQA